MRICQLQPHTHHAMNFRDLSGRSRPNDLARGIYPRERFLIYSRGRYFWGRCVQLCCAVQAILGLRVC